VTRREGDEVCEDGLIVVVVLGGDNIDVGAVTGFALLGEGVSVVVGEVPPVVLGTLTGLLSGVAPAI